MFDDSNKVGIDVVFLHGCPQSCMLNLVEGLLVVYEDMVEVLLVLEIFVAEDILVEDLICDAPFCSEACLFFSDGLLSLPFQSVQYDLQDYLVWVADEADRSIIQVAFPGKCTGQELGPRGWPFSCLLDLVADCR